MNLVFSVQNLEYLTLGTFPSAEVDLGEAGS